MPFNPTEKEKMSAAPPQVESTDQMPDMVHPVLFRDKAIAFAVLVVPYAHLLNWIVTSIEDYVPRQVYSLVMVAGIVGFLVLVAFGAHLVTRLRTRT